MCYVLHLSTSSSRDLSEEYSKIGFTFQRIAEDAHLEEKSINLLAYENRWYIGAESGCSCEFRHLAAGSLDLGFSQPEDWYPEEEDEIEATKALHGVLHTLLEQGAEVDLVDGWQRADIANFKSIRVDLKKVGPNEFRLFEDRRFELCLGS